MKLTSLTTLFVLVAAPLQAQEAEDVAVTRLLSSTATSSGQPIILPQKDAQVVVCLRSGAGGRPWRRKTLPTV